MVGTSRNQGKMVTYLNHLWRQFCLITFSNFCVLPIWISRKLIYTVFHEFLGSESPVASKSGPIQLEIKIDIIQAINWVSASPTLSMWVRGALIRTYFSCHVLLVWFASIGWKSLHHTTPILSTQVYFDKTKAKAKRRSKIWISASQLFTI